MTRADAASPVAVFGAGGHARVAIDVLTACGWSIAACLAPGGGEDLDGIPVLDEATGIDRLRESGVEHAHVALGDNRLRERVSTAAAAAGFRPVTAISPRAYVAAGARIGPGSLVVHGAIVNVGTTVGAGSIINTGATVDHDNEIGDFVHIAPGSNLAGTVRVGDRTLVGIGSAVIPGVSIGADVTVGAGSVVVTHLADKTRAWGNPARIRKAES